MSVTTKLDAVIMRAETLNEWATNVMKNDPDDADRILALQILELTEWVLENKEWLMRVKQNESF